MPSLTSKNGSDRPEALTHSAAVPLREFQVGGMDCASCAVAIERAVRDLEGVQAVQVDVMRGTVRVARDVGFDDGDLTRAIQGAGYTVRGPSPDGMRRQPGRLVAVVTSGLLLGVGLVLQWTGSPIPAVPLLAVAVVAGGWYVVPRGLAALKSRALDINFLMTIAAVGAAVIGQWGEAAAAMFLFAVAQLLEGFAMGRARRAIAALMELAPREAIVRRAGGDEVVPVGTIGIGEVILVRPGDRVPLDGIVIRGASALDQAPITGESMPVEKEQGSEVFAGSINGHGALEVRVTSVADDTTLAKILHAVEEAQASRAPSQTFVDRFARIYTPAVVGLALLLAVLPPLIAGADWQTWIYRALALLVIACPCALVISTPVTIVSGLTGAARDGVLIKGGAQLEAAADISTVVFDKTGTLTEGVPAVMGITPFDGRSEEEVLALAAAVERHSEHPVARAIVRAAIERGLSIPDVDGFTALPGRGARATVGTTLLYLGNMRICADLGTCSPAVHAVIEGVEQTGHTAILVTTSQAAIGVMAIADRLRDSARSAVAGLRRAGIDRVLMLTGDNEAVARSTARDLGLDEIRAGLLPDEKRAVVAALRQEGRRVAVVGDGINDAPALAAADVGIAMGAAGTHVALETADVVLMGDDLGHVTGIIQRARATVRIIKQNIAFSLVIKAVFLMLAVIGQATLWMAVAADTGASLAVIANGLRALGRPGALPVGRAS
jgi:Cd2+/Zn2+-exporting ATPase